MNKLIILSILILSLSACTEVQNSAGLAAKNAESAVVSTGRSAQNIVGKALDKGFVKTVETTDTIDVE